MGMADKIKERRIAMGLTQEELGQKLGVQKSAIAKYENGRVKNIKRSVILKIAEILQCSPVYLLDFNDENEDPNILYFEMMLNQALTLLAHKYFIREIPLKGPNEEQQYIIHNNELHEYLVWTESEIVAHYENAIKKNTSVTAESIVYPLWSSTILQDEHKLLTNYRKLNDTGKTKAQEDVEDLTQIPKYSADITLIQAAHTRTDVDMPEGIDASDDTYFD